MGVGDLIYFKCIGAGKYDNPPWSKDGEWRIGIIVGTKKIVFEVFQIYYRGEVFVALKENCSLIRSVQ